jgi:hypothetical protein
VDGLRALGGWSATLERTVRKTQQNRQYRISKSGRSAPCPRTVREQQLPRGQSAVSRRTVRPARGQSGTPTQTVRQTTCIKTMTPRRIYTRTRKNWTNTERTQTAQTVRSLQADGLQGTNKIARASNREVNLSYPSLDLPNGLSS